MAKYKCLKRILLVSSLIVIIAKLVIFIVLWRSIQNTTPSSQCCGYVSTASMLQYIHSSKGYNSQCTTEKMSEYGFDYVERQISVCSVGDIVCDQNRDILVQQCSYYEGDGYDCPSNGKPERNSSTLSDFHYSVVLFGIMALCAFLFNLVCSSIDIIGGNSKDSFMDLLVKCDCLYIICFRHCCGSGSRGHSYYKKMVFYNWQIGMWLYSFSYNFIVVDIYKYGLANLEWNGCATGTVSNGGFWDYYAIIGDFTEWHHSNQSFIIFDTILGYIGTSLSVINVILVIVKWCDKNSDDDDSKKSFLIN